MAKLGCGLSVTCHANALDYSVARRGKMTISVLAYSLFLVSLLVAESQGLQGDYVGCFERTNSASSGREAYQLAESPTAADSPSNCINFCQQQFYKYAGILNGAQCFCGSVTGNPSNENCSIPCRNAAEKVCGGSISISLYETGVLVASAPRSLSLLSRNENTLKISWEAPQVLNGIVQEYHVSATPVSSYSLNSISSPMEWTFPNNTRTADLTGLQPGNQYNITIWARTIEGHGTPVSAIYNTEIGVPTKPEAPRVVKSANNQVTLQLKPVLPTLGPISKYEVIVINEDVASFGVHKDTQLKNYNQAKVANLPYYITAELTPEQFRQEFVVGDGLTYNGYNNAPLPEDREVLFILGVVSTYGTISKVSFSEASKPVGVKPADDLSPIITVSTESPSKNDQRPVVIEEDNNGNGNILSKLLEEADATIRPPFRKDKPLTNGRSTTRRGRPRYSRDPPALVVGLSAAIGVLGFLLLVSIFVYFYLRHKVHQTDMSRKRRSRRPSDRQGLTMHGGSTIELENGYVHSSFVMGIEETSVDHYESLRQRLWTIPIENVFKTNDVIGSGQYGSVKKGMIQRGETNVEAAIHTIEEGSMVSGDRQSMLKDLSVLVKVGQHANIAGLLGVCEEPDTLLLAMEHYGINLKEFLLNSRALNNYPAYAEKEQRFSTLHEAQAIDIALGIAKGMAYLQSLSVPHRRLASRTVLICDGTVPKISGFGIDFFQPSGQSYDFKRWMAPEALSSPQHAPKCEVWSFAVILWEIVTLGATPYVDVRAKEFVQRVQRGMRLKQPANIGVSLYQIMISCWQIDLDERPNFQELFDVLQSAFHQALDYLSFNLFPEFIYERYDPAIELNR